MLSTHVSFSENPFGCDVCGRVFNRMDGLRYHTAGITKHARKHAGRSHPFQCDLCAKTYSTRFNILTHMKLMHFIKTRIYNCDVCTYKGKSARCLRRHTLVHVKPHKCRVCDKRFRGTSNLHLHMQQHASPDKLVCFCDRKFATSGGLQRHKSLKHGDDKIV